MTEQILRPEPLSQIDLSNFDPSYRADLDKQQGQQWYKDYIKRLKELQPMLYAQGEKALLVVFQAMDAGGKDGTIRNVFGPVNPQGVKVASFKKPTPEELSHDFLWRVHKRVPGNGYIGVFNRSHYEDVLVVRVNNLVPESVWSKRYDHINNFERLLADSGVTILKFYLHINKDEQKERFQSRLDEPHKNWKFSKGDLVVREQWDDYMQAYEVMLSKTNTDYAPWHIVPANRKWYRNYVITKTVVDTMENMDLAFPEPEEGLDQVVIPD